MTLYFLKQNGTNICNRSRYYRTSELAMIDLLTQIDDRLPSTSGITNSMDELEEGFFQAFSKYRDPVFLVAYEDGREIIEEQVDVVSLIMERFIVVNRSGNIVWPSIHHPCYHPADHVDTVYGEITISSSIHYRIDQLCEMFHGEVKQYGRTLYFSTDMESMMMMKMKLGLSLAIQHKEDEEEKP